MPTGARKSEPKPSSLVERRARRIANARSVTLGLAITFLMSAIAGGVVIRIVDSHNFPSFGLAIWWALQTVTTVGYGDVVPTTTAGRIVGGIEMVTGVSFIAFLTATVTSTVVQRSEAQADEANRATQEQNTQAIIDALANNREAILGLDKRLDHIEAKLTT